MSSALVEEMNIRVAEQARRFHALVQQHGPGSTTPGQQQQQQQQQGKQQQQQQPRQQQVGGAADPLGRLQEACRRAGLSYHPGSLLKVWRDISSYYTAAAGWVGGRKGGGKRRSKGGRGGGGGSDEEDEEGPKTTTTLVLTGNVDRRKHRCVGCVRRVLLGCVTAVVSTAQRSTAQQLFRSCALLHNRDQRTTPQEA